MKDNTPGKVAIFYNIYIKLLIYFIIKWLVFFYYIDISIYILKKYIDDDDNDDGYLTMFIKKIYIFFFESMI